MLPASGPAISRPGTAAPATVPSKRPFVRRAVLPFLLVALAIAAVLGTNAWFVGRPVRDALAGDPRNSGFSLHAHWAYYVQPSTLVLDLTRVDNAAPVDLLRGTFRAAEAMQRGGRTFDRVVLARAGTPVFFLTGEDFRTLGANVAIGENPVYLVRTFPEKLHRPDGSSAFGTWTGGLLGVVSKQMEDVTSAAREWAGDGRR